MFTVKQLAQMAGVSPATVSHVLHGREHKMKAATLEKVRAVIAETKYVPHMGGRLLGNHGSRLIGVILTWERRDEQNIVQDPFFSEIIGALEREIRRAGYFMLLYTSASVEENIRMAESWNVEGLIVLGSLWDDCTRFMRNTRIPLVFIDSYFNDDGLSYVNVGLEDRRGGALMAEYLIGRGHRRIAFLAGGEIALGADYERLCGCTDALEAAGLAPALYIPLHYKSDARRAFLRDFAARGMAGCTALFFASDFYAIDALTTFGDCGIHAPQDVSIAGFDGNIFSVQCRPRLATVRQDVSLKAFHAIKQALALIKGEPLAERIVRLPVTLCEGESVGKLRSSEQRA
ncbi:MAG: LacI family transcriptional regulator [Treponema sp.]|jgi:LacI family transcriptional regulator|nr:LacI family transcriptional regulator [Treponema sp.]